MKSTCEPSSLESIKARELLLSFFVFASSGESFWYTIDGDVTAEFSLCRRLGFFSEVDYFALLVKANLAGYVNRKGKDVLSILSGRWKEFLVDDDAGLSIENLEFSKKRFDIGSFIAGRTQRDKHRSDVHAIRIGRRIPGYASTITKQKVPGTKKFKTTPPGLPGLRSHQRTLTRASRDLIADVVLASEDFVDDACNFGRLGASNFHAPHQANKSADPPTPSSPEPKKSAVTSISTPDSSAPQPKETAVFTPATPEPTVVMSTVVAPSPPTRPPGFGMVYAALDEVLGKDWDLSTTIAEQALDKLISQAIQLKERQCSTKNTNFKFTDPRNGKVAVYTRIPKHTSEKAARKTMGWVDHCVNVNGAGDSTRGVKRLTSYLKRKHSDAFDEVLAAEGVVAPPVMKAHQVAALFKAGNVTARQNRRDQLTVLRHHFGRKAFDSEQKLNLLCGGRSEVKVGAIEYAYDVGGIPEIITYMQRNIANEVVAELTVS